MTDHRYQLVLLPPNRVWRTYPGGRTLDELERKAAPADSHWAEDWIASTTRATNPGREHAVEGISQVLVGHDPTPRNFAELLASDPEYFLGPEHVAKHGAQPHLLVKYLDSGTRLHFQVHPTRAFAQRVLGAPTGKTEAYHVLGCRPESVGTAARPGARPEPTGCIYVGFQRPPTRAELRQYILAQDIAAIERCFDRIPVRPGDTFLVPGGTPHALGAGVFMIEIQEPSDLVVRFEFERAGFVLPESARFMGRDLELALDTFDLSPLAPAEFERRVRCRPHARRHLGPASWQEILIGPAQTDCFRVAQTHLGAPLTKTEASCHVGIVTHGAVRIAVGGCEHVVNSYQKYFAPAGLGAMKLAPITATAEILECFPPQ